MQAQYQLHGVCTAMAFLILSLKWKMYKQTEGVMWAPGPWRGSQGDTEVVVGKEAGVRDAIFLSFYER